MASLGMMLAGSAIGQGAANYVHGQTQGAFDRQRLNMTEAQNNFQLGQMDRTLQQQQIEDTVAEGQTDEDRLNRLAEMAAKAGRGDLQRKYRAEAAKARETTQMQGIANASRAITLGQFGPAAQLLNKTGLFGDIHSIGLADDVEQDPRNPTYSVYTAGAPDANGKPTPGPHVHVNQQMLYQLQAKPGDALHWLAYAQAQGAKADQGDRKLDQADTKLKETERHNRAIEAARRAAGAAGGSGRLTNEQWRVQWAMKPKEQGGGGMTPQEAHTWAADPNKNSREYWNAMKVGTEVAKSGGLFTVEDIKGIVGALRQSPIGGPGETPPPPAPPAAPPKPAGGGLPSLASLGAKPVPGKEKEGVFQDARGRHFKSDGKAIYQWSPSKNGWVDVTAAITGAR